MAEFKLGRIRFVWQGEWDATTSYVPDDVVSVGGQTYICVIPHTSAALFETDRSAIPSKWNLVSGGTNWTGDWAISTYYNVGDLVKYGGLIYLCTEAHTSAATLALGLEDDDDKWDTFAESFLWRGTWTANTRYRSHDFVRYGGTTYVCNAYHTSAAATVELPTTGASATGGTATITFAAQVVAPYAPGASITIADVTPTEFNGTFTVTACTTTSVQFALAGTYGPQTIAGTVTGPSQLGLELDQGKWDIFNQGVTYLGDWAATTRYKLNDVVKYGASTWICVTPHTSTSTFDNVKFVLFVEGLQFEDSWDIATVYQEGDIVTYGGYSFIAKTNNVGQTPTTNSDDWDLYTTGFNFRGDWLSTEDYKVGDVVRAGAYTFVAIADNTAEEPPAVMYWSQLNSGFKWRTSSAEYLAVTGTNLIPLVGGGTGAEFDVERVGTSYIVTVADGGTGYDVGDKIKILGTDLGGISPANDLIITVSTEASNVIGNISYVGYGSTWTSGVTYHRGDVVFWGASSFVCLAPHTSTATPPGNRPDQDTDGDFWNLLSAGSEALVLTTEGDTYYYSANGPARLPIGTDGQILRVNQGFPAWEYYGIINNLVYVGPTGTDTLESGQGLSFDKPWASVRYALDQIEKGYHNRDACDLLRKNKQFIMKEVSNWVTYTYTVAISASSAATNEFTCNSTGNLSANMPIEFSGTVGGVTAGTKYYVKQVIDGVKFTISNTQGGITRTLTTQTAPMTGTLSYDEATCERDVGLLVDALIYDIGHGGNEESTKAARSYYDADGGNYINDNFAEQITQTVSAYEYLVSIAEDVLDNVEPTTSYQIENGVLVADQVAQIIDTDLTAETQAKALVSDLLDIVINGLLAQSELAIKAAVTSNTTVSVKTGTYFEVLPMIIPKNTAVVGDELRSTVIRPQPAIELLANDTEKTVASLRRVKDIIPDLLTSPLSIVKTPGNPLDPVAIVGKLDGSNVDIFGTVGEYAAAERVETAANTIYDILADGVTAAPVEIMPDPVGFDVDYQNARIQIANNYAFIKADVSRYIQNTYPAVWTALGATGQAKCQRDIEYILDAIRYDLTYGGNTQTLIAGRSYYTYINLVIPEDTEVATVAAYTHMKSIIDEVARRLSVTPQAGNVTPQSLSGTGGSIGAATFAQDRVQDVIDWIEDGESPTTLAPSLTWVDDDLEAGFAAIQSRKSEIQLDGLAWVNKFFQDLSFNEDTCSRDIGYMVDAIAYDMAFGSNFASIIAGKSYYRNLESALTVLASQKKASLGLVKFLKYKIRGLAVGGGSAKAQLGIETIVSYIRNGKQPRFQWPTFTGYDVENHAAAKLITQNKKFIAAEVQQFIDDNYPSIVYSEEKCMRDVEYIVDAVRYDLTYGGSFASKQAGVAYYSRLTNALQIDSADKTATLNAYAQLKTVLQAIASGGVYSTLQGTVTRITGTTGDATSSTLVGSLVDIITNIIDQGLTTGVPRVTITDIVGGTTFTTASAHGLDIGDEIRPQASANGLDSGVTYYVKTIPSGTQFTLSATWNGTAITSFTSGTGLTILAETTNLPDISWVSADMLTQATTLQSARATIISLVSDWIGENYPNLVYDSVTCQRDMGYVIDAVTYDMLMGSNFRAVKAGMAYYQAQASKVIGEQKRATLQTFRELRRRIVNTISSSDDASTSAKNGMDIIIDILEFGVGEQPEIHGTMSYANDSGLINSSLVIKANLDFLAEEASAYIAATYGGEVTDTTSPSNILETALAHNLSVNDPVRFTNVFGGVSNTETYYVTSVPSATEFTISLTKGGNDVSLTTSTGSMTVVYAYDPTSCKRDMREYMDALVYDLRWPGNYKTTRSAQLYLNAVKGSEYADMFRTRNACGLRNCTLIGLNGDLSALNDFGTKRPTAGAYVALDPGFGPNDESVWILTRSHYSQNVTMFGTGCSGAKIDSSLHNGGNKSMVKNDFTTIMSDGLGVWCTGSDSLTELVSVFNYYGYAGYLAEKGGRIRATNGNSSYGTYGVIAEGVSSKETPLYARVDNKAAQAQITNVVTDGTMEVLRLEFGNAGSDYSNTVHTVSGSGYNIEALADEYRDGAVFETRIIDPDDGNGSGGTNYASAQNAAQSGTDIEITIAATDTALTNAYNGMRIQITAGTGVGQYANILTFLNGSKVAQVYKDSFTSLTATNTTVTSNLITVASTASLYANMPIYFTGTAFGGITANIPYYVRSAGLTATQFTVSTTPGGGAVTLSTASGSMTILAAGWDHAVPGTPIEAALDLTTAYIIEPRVSYSAPGFNATARTLSSTTTWKDVCYGDNKFVAIANNSTSTSYSPDGVTWANAGVLPSSANWSSVVYAGGEGAVATAVVGGLSGRGAQFRAILGEANTTGAATADQVARVEILDGGQGYDTPPVIVFTAVSGGTGATATCAVLDGRITDVTVTIPGSGYNVAPTVSAATDRITQVTVESWGRGYNSNPDVSIGDPFTGSVWASSTSVSLDSILYHTNTTVTPNIKNWYRVTLAGTTGVGGPVHQSGTVSNGTASLLYIGTTAILTPSRVSATGTTDGVVSIAVTNTGAGYTTTPTVTILDSTAKYVAIATGSTDIAYTTRTGISTISAWTAGTALPASNLVSLAYGNNIYVAVGGASSAASSTSGTSFTTRTIPSLGAGTYSAVAYGAKAFVAISTGNNQTAYSTNGTSWTAGGTLPANTTWSGLAYGNGRFVAVASGGRNAAVSIDRGQTWVASPAGLPTSTSWTSVTYGQGMFIATASGTTACATSPDGLNWTARTLTVSSSWISGAFGNPSNTGIFALISAASGTIANTVRTGAQALGRVRVASGIVAEVRMIEPGSGYPKGTVSSTVASTDVINVSNTINLVDSMPVEFFGTTAGGLVEENTYYVIGSTITASSFKISTTAGSTTPVQLTDATISGMTYRAGPVFSVTDPNKVLPATFRVRLGDGALGNPSFSNRGADNSTAQAETLGDGYANLYQPSTFISVNGLYDIPTAGANVEFASLPGLYFKLVTVNNVLGDLGNYTATFQINPGLTVLQAPGHGDLITTRIKYSQVRLTGHDYLYIGTGNFNQTNYPNVDISTASQANQELFSGGGRVFFTATDQDGNFNVGDLFGVQQATGTATLNASAFNLSGLNSLQLGSVELGIGSAIITQFSTDPFFTADSDNVVPTQRAIKAYITAQIGGGQSSLNVNTLTAGVVYIAGNSISTTTGVALNVTSKMNFTGGIDGAPVALGFFMQR
jgi:hypothetical protein